VRGGIAAGLRGVFDPTGGLRNSFRDADAQFEALKKQLIDAKLPTEEYTRLLGMLAVNTEAAREQLAAIRALLADMRRLSPQE
jgi:hypothetical protein